MITVTTDDETVPAAALVPSRDERSVVVAGRS
jgi:hypothetical protein